MENWRAGACWPPLGDFTKSLWVAFRIAGNAEEIAVGKNIWTADWAGLSRIEQDWNKIEQDW